jgi:hypothetical protein
VEGLIQLPGAVRELVRNAPEYWESFRHKPSGEQVRGVSRVVTGDGKIKGIDVVYTPP